MLKEQENSLIAFFTWSGNTRELANLIHKYIGGDMFEIKPKVDYPVDYSHVLDIAKHEILSAKKPELKKIPASIEKYTNIFIGFPNWCNTFPAPVLTFLSMYSFDEKNIIPFCTHGGGGMGRSVSEVANQCCGAKIIKGFSMNGSLVGRNHEQVEKWLKEEINTIIS